ncbi:MAG: adenylate/guanylate cyclase domain-containing protein, partial [Steroidobacteraceae bacterium]|nr:adenylate/guanylate cyclase domain-containing protein [Steroidobacteraceae bacterium]MDW8260629.1 adenylate/guanylate cyclase domain-containing protein [Gammaproteobacteria bacterium]
CVLFADVVGSTRLFEALGDLKARDTIAICIDIMRGATEKFRGTVIKTMGDEIMATFPSADDALDAAALMQQQIATHSMLKIDGHQVAIRVGCHIGPVVIEQRDVFGATVHTANRATSQAKAGQILTTSAMVSQVSVRWQTAVRQIDVATLRGQGAEVALYEVLWQTDDVTNMLPSIAFGVNRDSARPKRLKLTLQDQVVIVDDSRPQVIIGRAEEGDLVVRGGLISRLHARVEISRNKFVLIDQSTNGTFVVADTGEEAFLRRDSMQIKGGGMIGLGRAPDRASPLTIRYVCED